MNIFFIILNRLFKNNAIIFWLVISIGLFIVGVLVIFCWIFNTKELFKTGFCFIKAFAVFRRWIVFAKKFFVSWRYITFCCSFLYWSRWSFLTGSAGLAVGCGFSTGSTGATIGCGFSTSFAGAITGFGVLSIGLVLAFIVFSCSKASSSISGTTAFLILPRKLFKDLSLVSWVSGSVISGFLSSTTGADSIVSAFLSSTTGADSIFQRFLPRLV